MDEFIREVDEEYRRHRLAEIWNRYSVFIVGAAVILVAAVGGWRYWEHVQTGRSEVAAIRFDDALKLSRDGKSDDAASLLRDLSTEAPDGYRLLARFRLAAEIGRGDAAAGARAFDALAEDATLDAGRRDLARLRAAMLRTDGAEAAAATAAFERLAVPANPWRHTAREMLGLAALKRGDPDAASRWFDQIAQDRETPQALRGRLEVYSALAAGGPVQPTQ